MEFKDIAGNEQLKEVLVGMADSGKIPHAMLFYENDGCGAFALVQAWLQYIFNTSGNKVAKMIHPDIHYIYPVNIGSLSGSLKSDAVTSDTYIAEFRKLAISNPYFLEEELNNAIGLEGRVGIIAMPQAKALMNSLYLSPVEDGYKVVVVYLPEKMNDVCANKLLKVIEEPPEMTLFMMITHNPDKVIQTIFSRCQSFRVLPAEKGEVAEVLEHQFGMNGLDADRYAMASGGSVGQALYLATDSEDYRFYMNMFSDLMQAIVAKDLLTALEVSEDLAAIDSKEKQKAFLVFAGDALRKIYVLQNGLPEIAGIREEDSVFYENMARQLPQRFCEKVLPILDKTMSQLARNVSQKMLFTDLTNRIFLSI